MSGPPSLESLADEHGESARATAEAWLDELLVLTFRENRRGGDPIAHTPDGRAVFPDKYRDGERIMTGETWLCTVSKKGDNTFFAAPLARLDESFFRGLMPAERRRVAEVLWEEQRDVVLDELRDMMVDEGASFRPGEADPDDALGALATELAQTRRERDELRDRLAELMEQYDEAAARLATSQRPLGRSEPEPDRGPFPVTRPTPDVLECAAFEDRHWHGHVSPDGRTVFLKAHPRGPLSCEDGRLVLPGLARLLPRPVEGLEARYDPRHGGFFIALP